MDRVCDVDEIEWVGDRGSLCSGRGDLVRYVLCMASF